MTTELTTSGYVTARTDTARIGSTVVIFTPEYFRKYAQAYIKSPGNRTKFLQSQIVDLESSLSQYARAMQDVMNKGAKLNGQSNAASWMTAIGSGISVIPTGVTQIGGAVLAISGAVIGFVKRNKDTKELRELGEEAARIQQDMTEIQRYYSKYQLELLLRKWAIPAAIFYFIYKY